MMKKNKSKKVLALFSLIMLIVLSNSCKKEKGCTDPESLNYNPEAVEDDGSCKYNEITSNDFTQAGAVHIYKNYISPEGATNTIGDAGKEMTWDYSFAVANIDNDTIMYVDPMTDTLFAENPIPGVNLAQKYSGVDDMSLLSVTDTKAETLAYKVYRDGIGRIWSFENPLTLAEFPVRYNDSFTDDSKLKFPYTIQVNQYDQLYKQDEIMQHGEFLADGEGSVTTPTGTYDCIRIYTRSMLTYKIYDADDNGNFTIASFTFEDTTYTYQHYNIQQKASVCNVMTDEHGKILAVRYLK